MAESIGGLACRAEGIVLHFGSAPTGRPALEIPDLDVAAGARIGITGPSGCGKSTLLNVLTGIELPQQGSVTWGEEAITAGSGPARARWRRHNVGFVFQDFQLVPELSALQNVLLPWRFDRVTVPPDVRASARTQIEQLGVMPDRRCSLLSRGEQQRVAVARALARDPHVLVADEPTASLDAEAGAAITELLIATARHRGATLIVVSHDQALLSALDATLVMRGGQIVERRSAP